MQENVSLEERLRDMRVSEIRFEKTVEILKEEVDVLKKQERKAENENRSLTDILNNIREENNVLRAQMHTPAEHTDRRLDTLDQKNGQMPAARAPPLSVHMKDVGIQVDLPEEIVQPSTPERAIERKFCASFWSMHWTSVRYRRPRCGYPLRCGNLTESCLE